MGESTNIAWTDHTFNPWIGCQAISPGCDHCYAEAYAKRVGRDFAQRTRTSAEYWKQPFKWDRAARERGTPTRVFCSSLADVFDNEVPEQWRKDLFDVIARTPHLTWQLLTKRIGNAHRMLIHEPRSPFPNVWLGITVVNQEEADRDIRKLLALIATKRFLSVEPMLGPINIQPYARGIDWVICGGESGHHARTFELGWARDLAQQCREAGVSFFMKQLGTRPDFFFRLEAKKTPGYPWSNPAEWPEDLQVQEFPA